MRKVVIEYSMKNKIDIKILRNDKRRVRAHRTEGCPWSLYASYDSRAKTIVVKRYVAEHNCRRE